MEISGWILSILIVFYIFAYVGASVLEVVYVFVYSVVRLYSFLRDLVDTL